jgi:capsular polysaccharide biosynthesis protein/Mrp family chromosome partitioning ATPase
VHVVRGGQSEPMPKNAILHHYARVIRDRSILILLFFVMCTSITYIVSLDLPPIYQATTIIKIGTVTGSEMVQTQALADNGAVLATSPEVLQMAAQSLAPITLKQLQQATNSSVADHTQLLVIQSQAISAQQAIKIANVVAKSYIQVQQEKETTYLQATLQALALQLRSTRQSLDTAQQGLDTLKAEAGTEQNISQQKSLLDTNQNSYNQLLSTYSQAQLQKVQVPDMLHIIQPATLTGQPTSPHIWLNTLLAAGISLVTLCLLALFADWLDSSIKTADDIASLSGLEPLGQIPFLRSLHANSQLLDFSEENLDAIREAVAVMGMNFQMLYKGQHALLCTCLHKQVGTSMAASQLATTLAHSGIRVLLIDTHFERPGLHTIFNLPNAYGLTNSINDFMAQPSAYTADWLAQWKTYVPNLWLLPTGPTHDRYQTQIATPHLIQLKERLLEQPAHNMHAALPQLIDIIIFDAPPLEDGSLTQRLTAVTDASILVIKSHQDQPENLLKARRILQHLETPILGVVINRYKARYRSYFYSAQRPYSTEASLKKNLSLDEITSQKHIIEKAKILPLEVVQDTETTKISPYRELPETPQPWKSSELLSKLLTRTVQPKLSLPGSTLDQTQRFNSLLHPAVIIPERKHQQETPEKLTRPLPIANAEQDTRASEELLDDPITSLKLPSVKKQSIQNLELRASRRNTYQFKNPYEQEEYEEYYESREQLT